MKPNVVEYLFKKYHYIYLTESLVRLSIFSVKFTYSKSTIETLEKGVKYVQS